MTEAMESVPTPINKYRVIMTISPTVRKRHIWWAARRPRSDRQIAVRGVESCGGIEFTDTVVSGNSVTANYAFFNEDGECFGGKDTEVSVEDDKITLYVWGPSDPSQCG